MSNNPEPTSASDKPATPESPAPVTATPAPQPSTDAAANTAAPSTPPTAPTQAAPASAAPATAPTAPPTAPPSTPAGTAPAAPSAPPSAPPAGAPPGAAMPQGAPSGAPQGAPAGGPPGAPAGGPPPREFSDQPLNEDTVPNTDNLYIFGDPRFDRDRLIAQSFLYGQWVNVNAKRFIRKPPNRILDFGCGDGQISLVLKRLWPKAEIVAMDNDPRAIDTAKKLLERAANISGTITYVVGDENSLPDGEFDLIYVSMVLVHLRNPQQAIDNLVKKLVPGGILWIKDVNTDSLMQDVEEPNWRYLGGKMLEAFARIGAQPYIARELPEMFKKAGLQDVKVEKEIYRLGDKTLTAQVAISIHIGALNNAIPMMSRVLQLPMDELREKHKELSKNALNIKGAPHYMNVIGEKPKQQ